ncbi:nicotinamide N-methyltransferase-like [Pelobates cultripes]|uniref:Nicotinamide N-methyltransferase-like n=1 Tax=Pelobates cultripes TaxID=61616 RepID=A0AAD1WSF0_PELCU|nr:nicotinamide N-methyltransferase-like [Pelobates cultripes]
MDPSSHKRYHLHEWKPLGMFNKYFSGTAEKYITEEVVRFPIEQIYKVAGQGQITGELLIDISVGPAIYHLLPIFEFFKDITILEFSDLCVKELKEWKNKESESYDWTHALSIMAELQGTSFKGNETENALRRSISHILKCDFTKETFTEEVFLPKADCVLSMYVLHLVSDDQDDYSRNLKKVSGMLKLGGHLLLFGLFNAKYYTIGENKFHLLATDKKSVEDIMREAGFVIELLEVKESKMRDDTTYLEHFYFIKALKKSNALV